MRRIKEVLVFGRYDIQGLIKALFCIGNVPIAIFSFLFGNWIYKINTYMRVIDRSGNLTTSIEENNLALGVVIGALVFVSFAIIWRIVCELIYFFMKYHKDCPDGIEDKKELRP